MTHNVAAFEFVDKMLKLFRLIVKLINYVEILVAY